MSRFLLRGSELIQFVQEICRGNISHILTHLKDEVALDKLAADIFAVKEAYRKESAPHEAALKAANEKQAGAIRKIIEAARSSRGLP